jgi:hypothetical protein
LHVLICATPHQESANMSMILRSCEMKRCRSIYCSCCNIRMARKKLADHANVTCQRRKLQWRVAIRVASFEIGPMPQK